MARLSISIAVFLSTIIGCTKVEPKSAALPPILRGSGDPIERDSAFILQSALTGSMCQKMSAASNTTTLNSEMSCGTLSLYSSTEKSGMNSSCREHTFSSRQRIQLTGNEVL